MNKNMSEMTDSELHLFGFNIFLTPKRKLSKSEWKSVR
jgi:hypothetical protein